MHVCGKEVPPDPDTDDAAGPSRSAFRLSKGPSEVLEYPGTVVLLAINAAVAYYLWAKNVRGRCEPRLR